MQIWESDKLRDRRFHFLSHQIRKKITTLNSRFFEPQWFRNSHGGSTTEGDENWLKLSRVFREIASKITVCDRGTTSGSSYRVVGKIEGLRNWEYTKKMRSRYSEYCYKCLICHVSQEETFQSIF